MAGSILPSSASIVSGYFGPLHEGHLDLFEAARSRNDWLIVIVNNDDQQLLKKGRIIQDEAARLRIVRSLRVVDDALVSLDSGPGIDLSFDRIRELYPAVRLEFCNGGDRTGTDRVPTEEVEAAARNDIEMLFGIGGTDKADSSSRIIASMEQSPP